MNPAVFSPLESNGPILLLVLLILSFAVLAIPSLLVPGAKPEGVTKAIASMFMMVIGVTLVAMSSGYIINALMTIRIPQGPEGMLTMFTLILGIGIIAHQSRVNAKIDAHALAIPRLICGHAIAVVGILLAIIGAALILAEYFYTMSLEGWETGSTLILVGVTLSLTMSMHFLKASPQQFTAKRVRK